MDTPDATGNDNLDRLSEMLAGLGATLGSSGLLAWAGPGDIAAMPHEVFRVVRDAGLLGEGDPRRPVSMPADGDALMERMWEVDEPEVIGLLCALAGSTRSSTPRHPFRRRQQQDPQDIFAEMARLTGPGTRWWTNTDLTTWNPITQHTFDAVVVGAGDGMIVTLIAFEGGE